MRVSFRTIAKADRSDGAQTSSLSHGSASQPMENALSEQREPKGHFARVRSEPDGGGAG